MSVTNESDRVSTRDKRREKCIDGKTQVIDTAGIVIDWIDEFYRKFAYALRSDTLTNT